MKTKYDKETGITSWIISSWWQKTIYVLSFIYTGWLLFCFLMGLFIGLSVL